ncbi:MAG: radical SAM protein [Candidatus Brocadiia bacterium]
MAGENLGVCGECQRRVPAEHIIRDGQVYLRKNCPDCGPNEALISTHAAAWQRKREVCHYEGEPIACSLRCESCDRSIHHPRMVFLDVTNRCNMNCPICINNTPGMGFVFNPPLSYFERVLTWLAQMDPPPLVQLFGGEPTVRDDLLQIIQMGRDRGLDMRVVTNGLKLADEEYCRRLCESKVHVLIAFDGHDRDIYRRLRGNAAAYDKKLQALENLRKHSRHKNTIMCCVARHINDVHMGGLIRYCHDNRDHIKCMHLIPLTETWQPGEFETDVATTTEDVEAIMDAAFPDERCEFVPAGITKYVQRAARFIGSGARLKFGGVHPNCESGTYLLSDGERYHPLGSYLKRPLLEVAEQFVSRARKLDEKLAGLDPDRWTHRWRGRLLVLSSLLPLLLRSLDSRKILRGNRLMAVLRILGGLLVGKRLKDQLRKHTNLQDAMLMIVLPFEEPDSIESARLQNCFAGFAYIDPDTDEVTTMPVCVWGIYQRDIQSRITEKYGEDEVTSVARGGQTTGAT